jgi:hydroxypyruvate reductase
MAVPTPGISLAEKARTTNLLLGHGADIHALNTVRKHLSAIKGGRLAAATVADTLTFAVSDVVGDDLGVIGSGPTVGDATTFGDALAVLERFGGQTIYPRAVIELFAQGARGDVPESPKPADPSIQRATSRVIGGRHDAARGAAEEARARGYHPVIREMPTVGDARQAAAAYLDWSADQARSRPRPLAIISSGETTVRVLGTGTGGRNQEFALAAAAGLGRFGPCAALASFGTDGVDGPTDAAGAIADPTTCARAAGVGLDPDAFLTDNNSYAFFHTLGDLIRTGPTGTNVGDLQVLLVR